MSNYRCHTKNTMSTTTNDEQVPVFISKIFEMLEVIHFLYQRPELKEMICWNHRNDGFIIKNPSSLEEEVLPQYFKHNKVQSLIRQLNMYDFHKARTKDSQKEFKHEYFKRSKPELLKFIRRKLGEEANTPNSKPDILLQRCRELEDRCQTYESMAKLSIPIKKLKTISNEDSSVLLEGLINYLDADTKEDIQNEAIRQATQDYIHKLKQIKDGTYFQVQPVNQLEEICQPSDFDEEGESYLSKRHINSEMTASPLDVSEDHQPTFGEEQSTCNSLESLEFNMDLLDFDCHTKTVDSSPFAVDYMANIFA